MSSIFLPSRLDKYVKTGSSLDSRGVERLTLSCTPWRKTQTKEIIKDHK